jgi:hypothetical protein
MQFRVVSFTSLVIAVVLQALPGLRADEYRLYYLGGQSNMDGYGYSDKWHYDSAGYIDLGRQFAEAMANLERQK